VYHRPEGFQHPPGVMNQMCNGHTAESGEECKCEQFVANPYMAGQCNCTHAKTDHVVKPKKKKKKKKKKEKYVTVPPPKKAKWEPDNPANIEWEYTTDKRGRHFYTNKSSKVIQWEEPEGFLHEPGTMNQRCNGVNTRQPGVDCPCRQFVANPYMAGKCNCGHTDPDHVEKDT